MTTRKSAQVRRKEFELAILRIEHGRAKTNPRGLSIAAVAAEVGVSHTLIHVHYPDIAEQIRSRNGSATSAAAGRKQSQLEHALQKNVEARRVITECEEEVRKLATINDMLLDEIAELKARLQGSNVLDMGRAKK
ncbi:TetR family transcriptional regulator [Ralstonia mannitolilytica]|uniref:TetR family transcriptional regulator n=1 Tax=Ralstonia mannitolilytica TaxID=105219 RepID=UPI00292DAA82|nr:TetR family transcriptional regulator [Ralstonia mannitolilytica]